jgi:hypothetical protein
MASEAMAGKSCTEELGKMGEYWINKKRESKK